MTWKDNTAGWVTANLWPAYLMAKKDKRGYPDTIAFGKGLYTEIIKLIDNRQIEFKGSDGKKPAIPDKTFMSMTVVYDEVLDDDGWDMRWTE